MTDEFSYYQLPQFLTSAAGKIAIAYAHVDRRVRAKLTVGVPVHGYYCAY